jgi:hypothetical protein
MARRMEEGELLMAGAELLMEEAVEVDIITDKL